MEYFIRLTGNKEFQKMKTGKLILFFIFISSCTRILSQTVVVTDDPAYTTGNASSMLDIKSTSKGLLIPRVTLTSSLSSASPVSSPATGLLVYNEGANQPVGFYYWNGSAWTTAAGPSTADGSETKVNGGISVTVSGSGTVASPYVLNFAPQFLTYANRASLSPVTGQLIYCTDCGASGQLQVFNGTTWTNITGGAAAGSGVAIGDSYLGGKVAYIYQPGDPGYVAGQTHGLIAAVADLSTSIVWGCTGTAMGTTATALGQGYNNSFINASMCMQIDASYNAWYLIENTYDDWYLPSKDELNKLYLNQALIGGFTNTGYYWSSTEQNSTLAWDQYFGDGSQVAVNKSNTLYARAVRSF